jgi:hypothetical protein
MFPTQSQTPKQDVPDVPKEFCDSNGVPMLRANPVQLADCGHIFEYHTVAQAITAENRECPQTECHKPINTPFKYLPELKAAIKSWMEQNGLSSSPSPEAQPSTLRSKPSP